MTKFPLKYFFFQNCSDEYNATALGKLSALLRRAEIIIAGGFLISIIIFDHALDSILHFHIHNG